MNRKAVTLILIFLIVTLVTSLNHPNFKVQASPDWLTGWGKRVQITINSTDVDTALSNFPVLMFLSNSSAGENDEDVSFVFDELTSDTNRKKIAVTTSDGETQCYVEIEKWDDANEQAWLWFKAPSISNTSDTDFYLYYDVDHADNTAYVGDIGSTPAQNVWDTNFVMVQHMRDNTTSSVLDSTSYGNDGTKVVANEPIEVDGKIAKAQNFDGNNDLINCGTGTNLDPSDAISIAVWVKPNSPSVAYHTIAGKWKVATNERAYWMSSYGLNIYWYISKSGADWKYSAVATDNDAWNYIVGTYDGTNIRVYKNGAIADTDLWEGTINQEPAIDYFIGASGWVPDRFYPGVIDELRQYQGVLSDAWIKATYETERDHLLDFGSEEEGYSTYTISISSDPSFVYQGETVTLTVSVTKDEAPFADYIMNVTKDGALWKQNIIEANSTFTDQETGAISHTYSVSALYDTTLGTAVDYSVTPLTVNWNIPPSSPPTPVSPGMYESIVFDLFVSTSDYIILPFHSSVTATIDVYNRVSRDAEVMFVWTIIDSDNLQVKNGSFLHLILGYQSKTLEIEVPAPTEEGDYVLQVDVPAIDVTGSTTYPFHVYGVTTWLLGPGIFTLVAVTVATIIVMLYVKKQRFRGRGRSRKKSWFSGWK